MRLKQDQVFCSVLNSENPDKSDLDLLIEQTPDTTLMDNGVFAMR